MGLRFLRDGSECFDDVHDWAMMCKAIFNCIRNRFATIEDHLVIVIAVISFLDKQDD